jgi:molecular chaperone GrpE
MTSQHGKGRPKRDANGIDSTGDGADVGDPEVLGAPSGAETDEGTTASELQEEMSRLTDRHLRLAADFDNYRKRVERERVDAHSRAQAELVSRLLDVLDDLQRVLQHGETLPSDPLLDGVRLVERKLLQVLESSGLEALTAEGAVFDPTTMEALATAPAEHPEEEDVVAAVFQRGYRFKGHLIRPSRVSVKKYEG